MKTLLMTVFFIYALKFLIRFVLLWENDYPRKQQCDHTDDLVALFKALVLATWAAFVIWM